MERLRALIVDDNAHMINIIKTILRGFGIKHFYEAKDAADAFDTFKSEAIDIIFVDYQMDLLDGLDFIKLVRTADDSPAPFIPIIMITAYSERSRVITARDAGVTEFCNKPINAHEMFRKLVSVIDHPRDFVRTSSYFGPNRRRHDDTNHPGPFRRKDDGDRSEEDALPAETDAIIPKVQDFTAKG
ncbi:Chemotaxis protein CheYIII [hydrothermal vent metagenome]|uniref:Chemotaxis protein CheYIII n=1 Tax=hydrothermal vent metagenome TaxID=652676 RepID=A0A3B0RV44_9ZZZZ